MLARCLSVFCVLLACLSLQVACNNNNNEEPAANNTPKPTSTQEPKQPQGDESPQAIELKTGQEHTPTVQGGSLQLHGCEQAELFSLSTGVGKLADNKITTVKQFPPLFVLGEVGNNCQLQHLAKGKSKAYAYANIASSSDNKAMAVQLTFDANRVVNPLLQVTLPAQPTDLNEAIVVYASNDRGVTWHDQVSKEGSTETSVAWAGKFNFNDISYDIMRPYAHQVLLQVTSKDGQAWWHMYEKALPTMEISAPAAPQKLAIKGLGNTQRDIKVKVGEDCGLQFFLIVNYNEVARQITADSDSTINVSGGKFVLAAIGKQTAGCRMALHVDGVRITAPADLTIPSPPAISGITVTSLDAGSQRILINVTLPAWPYSTQVPQAAPTISVTEGTSWHIGSTQWNSATAPGPHWNSDNIKDNRAVIYFGDNRDPQLTTFVWLLVSATP